MITILVFHTEVHYKAMDITPYYIYTTNAIVLFYCISGYLFYKETPFDFIHKFKSIIKNLVIPYFLFTTVLAIPKALIHENFTIIYNAFTPILFGNTSWFICALIVAELVFSILLTLSKKNHILLSIASIGCFILYILLPQSLYNFWQWQDALLAIPFLYIGYVYHQYESTISPYTKPAYAALLSVALLFIKAYEYHLNLPLKNIMIENPLLFIVDMLCFLCMVINLIAAIPHQRMIEWTGKQSLIYYFFCSGIPLLVSMILNRIDFSYDHLTYRFILTVIIVYLLTSFIVWLIDRYIPLMKK